MDAELPDIRVVSITTRVEGDEVGEPAITISGTGFYEALGMLVAGLVSMLVNGEGALDDDDYPAEWED